MRAVTFITAGVLIGEVLLAPACPGPVDRGRLELPGLGARARVSFDEFGVPHVEAKTELDAFRVQGFLHARDRFFQMDWNRRAADGRLAEFSGHLDDLSHDASIRLLGLRAAAQRSLDALEPRELAVLQAYADGVNAWLASNPLPPEYEAIEISVVPPWAPVDTLLLAKGFFATLNGPRIWEIDETDIYQGYVAAIGPERAALLYPDEMGRFASWIPFATVPDALGLPLARRRTPARPVALQLAGADLARTLHRRAAKGSFMAGELEHRDTGLGSNAWGVAGAHSATGMPLVAGDPHLGLTAPSAVYEIHLLVDDDPEFGRLIATGGSMPGIPAMPLGGQTARVAWAFTVFAPDISDVFRDRLVRGDPGCPTRLCVRSAGALHGVEERPETYRWNLVSDGVLDNSADVTASLRGVAPQAVDVLTVPFRSFGPIVEVTDRQVLSGGTATETDVLTLQWTGFHADRAARWLLDTLHARDVFEFGEAVRWLTWGGLHHVVGDVEGNLAYYAGGEIPLRTDLEAGVPIDGMPPWWIRDGAGAANWIEDPARSQAQVLPFAVIPPAEMPHVVNPPAGFVVNCNEDASGFGLDNDLLNQARPSNPQAIHYLGDLGTRGLRNGRVTKLLRSKINAGERITLDDIKHIQADTVAVHAELFVPYLLRAFESARRPDAPQPLALPAGDPRVAEAMARLATWDFSHPTGIPEGYDAADVDGVRSAEVSDAEMRASVAATIYEAWLFELRARVSATLEAAGIFPYSPLYALLYILQQAPFTGVGASGVDYFPEPTALAAAADRRDAVLLDALRDALDALAGPAFADAFEGSTTQDDYRWGKLHRIAAIHGLGGSASIPPAGGFEDLSPSLPGLARDGTWDTVNTGGVAGVPTSAAGWFNAGKSPLSAWRHVHALLRASESGSGVTGFAATSGGASGNPDDPSYTSQLGLWLTSDYHAVPMTSRDVRAAAKRVEIFEPATP